MKCFKLILVLICILILIPVLVNGEIKSDNKKWITHNNNTRVIWVPPEYKSVYIPPGYKIVDGKRIWCNGYFKAIIIRSGYYR